MNRNLVQELQIRAPTDCLFAVKFYNTLMSYLASLRQPSVSLAFCTLNRQVWISNKSC